jgi:hypothetical protein
MERRAIFPRAQSFDNFVFLIGSFTCLMNPRSSLAVHQLSAAAQALREVLIACASG